jgi:VCBS repeat protein
VACETTAGSAQVPPSAAAIVQQFYPQRLVDLGEQTGGPFDRRQCYAVYDTEPSGAPRTIVAAYTNTSSAAIRVLRANGGGSFDVVADPQEFDFFGSRCEVTLPDLDNDGRRDIIVTFGMMVSDVSWVFKWDGQQLDNLTPVTANGDGTLKTDLYNAEALDIDGDGVMEIYSVGQYPPSLEGPSKPDLVYKLFGDRYLKSETVVGLWTFERTTGAPEVARVPVPLPAGARGPYTLHVVNGEAGGRSRVTSAQVWLNDRQVLGPNDFSNRIDVIDRPVPLDADNELAVRLAGAPGSRIRVILKSRGWAP